MGWIAKAKAASAKKGGAPAYLKKSPPKGVGLGPPYLQMKSETDYTDKVGPSTYPPKMEQHTPVEPGDQYWFETKSPVISLPKLPPTPSDLKLDVGWEKDVYSQTLVGVFTTKDGNPKMQVTHEIPYTQLMGLQDEKEAQFDGLVAAQDYLWEQIKSQYLLSGLPIPGTPKSYHDIVVKLSYDYAPLKGKTKVTVTPLAAPPITYWLPYDYMTVTEDVAAVIYNHVKMWAQKHIWTTSVAMDGSGWILPSATEIWDDIVTELKVKGLPIPNKTPPLVKAEVVKTNLQPMPIEMAFDILKQHGVHLKNFVLSTDNDYMDYETVAGPIYTYLKHQDTSLKMDFAVVNPSSDLLNKLHALQGMSKKGW